MKNYLVSLCIIFAACSKDSAVDMSPIDANGEILFISRRISNSADWQMFVMNADGSNQRILSNDIVQCAPPALSNGRTKVAFTTYDNNLDYSLYIIDTDGNNQKLLSKSKQFCGTPVWSADDSRITFVKVDNNPGSTSDIYSIKLDGSDEIKLTEHGYNFSPQYFPDNKSIIYSADFDNWIGVYKMNADGSNKQLLTPQNKSFGTPKISPTGNKIAVTSADPKGSQIFVMDSDGKNLKQLTFTVSSVTYPGWPPDGNGEPAWSPNGDKLAYVSYANGSPDIFTINATGTANKRLTDSPLRDEHPYWTKDGKYILFSSNRSSDVSSEIYIMRTEGQLQTPLTNYIADDIFPAFINK